ncbi:hypothetical protein [Salibacterium halotolerans]|uniref:Tetratricopeptide repeat-containing protein n=1 Tax=Salibacterium halotolerans TaxID=1884432 RepID=A0A1I5N5Y3_9BACI|nr:hypothetical protein [Salibacterium halotolerans]SFP17325.1 hypothetical protein SAMN05518683_10313 [Salibacterium halotolerans]
MNYKLLPFIVVTSFSLLIVAGCSSEYNEKMEQGEEAEDNQNYNNAIAAYSAALEIKPEDEDAQESLEDVKSEKQRIEERRAERERKEEQERKEQQAREDDEQKYLSSLDQSTIAGKAKASIFDLIESESTPSNQTFNNVIYDSDIGLLEISIPSDGNVFTGLIADGFRSDTLKIFERLSNNKQFEKVKTIAVEFTMALEDEYGNTEPGRVFRARAKVSELKKMDDPSYFILPKNLDQISENVFVHPSLR